MNIFLCRLREQRIMRNYLGRMCKFKSYFFSSKNKYQSFGYNIQCQCYRLPQIQSFSNIGISFCHERTTIEQSHRTLVGSIERLQSVWIKLYRFHQLGPKLRLLINVCRESWQFNITSFLEILIQEKLAYNFSYQYERTESYRYSQRNKFIDTLCGSLLK